MKDAVKKIATISLILLAMLVVIFYLFYQEYEYTYIREERMIESARVAETELTRSLYKSLKRETQAKTDRLSRNIREDLIENYGDDIEKFAEDYENPTDDSILVTTIGDVLEDESDRFFYIQNRSNDIFALSTRKDEDGEATIKGITRILEDEIELHYNKPLAEQSIEGLLDGNDQHMFWRFNNTANDDGIGLKNMNIDNIFTLPLECLQDYEFLTVSYIDKYGDILGMNDFSATGEVNDTKKIMIVQGFNLHEHIEREFKDSYTRIAKNEKLQLAVIEENRKGIAVKLFVVMGIIIISFIAMAIIQDIYVKGCGVDVKSK